jgi:quaternary ammonium compound-resistance protein SugE
MVWLVLVFSAVLEAVWANALGASEGFTRLGPSLLFIVAIIPGMFTLAYVAKRVPMSTAYAVWAGLGAAFTVTWAMLTGTEPATIIRILLIIGIVTSVVGLKLIKPARPHDPAQTPAH